MGLLCWIGWHDWEIVRKSLRWVSNNHPGSRDKFAIADITTDFSDIADRLTGSGKLVRFNSGTGLLLTAKGRETLDSVPEVSDRICKRCDKTRLDLTKKVISYVRYFVAYESPEAQKKRRQIVEETVKKTIEKKIKRHPVETY